MRWVYHQDTGCTPTRWHDRDRTVPAHQPWHTHLSDSLNWWGLGNLPWKASDNWGSEKDCKCLSGCTLYPGAQLRNVGNKSIFCWVPFYFILFFFCCCCSIAASINQTSQLTSTYFSPLLPLPFAFRHCGHLSPYDLFNNRGGRRQRRRLNLMWEHFLLCIKEPSANLQNTNKVTGCARTPVEKPGTNSACTTARSAVFILEGMALRVSFIFRCFFFFFFSFYWSKFSITNSLQQNNKYGTFIECYSYCKKYFWGQKQIIWSSNYSAGSCRKGLQPCLLQPRCFEAPVSVGPMFCEQLGDTRVIIVQLLFSSSLPHSFLHHAGGRKMWHWGNILALSFFSCSASEKKKGGSGRDTFSALNLQQAERCAAVTVVSQLTVVLPQLMRINVTLQKTQERNHPEGIYVKQLFVVVYV